MSNDSSQYTVLVTNLDNQESIHKSTFHDKLLARNYALHTCSNPNFSDISAAVYDQNNKVNNSYLIYSCYKVGSFFREFEK